MPLQIGDQVPIREVTGHLAIATPGGVGIKLALSDGSTTPFFVVPLEGMESFLKAVRDMHLEAIGAN